MPATKPVSFVWQVVFSFIPILNVWAFYRIRKLRKYILFVILPQIAILAEIGAATSRKLILAVTNPVLGLLWPNNNPTTMLSDSGVFLAQVVGVALQSLTVYLVIKWSQEHNRRFDMSTMTSGP